MKWWHWLPFVPLLLALVACEPALSFPPHGNPGPASLQLVPADYYSRGLRPGPDRGPTKSRIERQESQKPEPETVPAPAAPAADLDQKLLDIRDRVRALRDRLNKPPPKTEPDS